MKIIHVTGCDPNYLRHLLALRQDVETTYADKPKEELTKKLDEIIHALITSYTLTES